MRRKMVSLMFAGQIGIFATPLAAAGRPAAEEARASAAPVAVQRRFTID